MTSQAKNCRIKAMFLTAQNACRTACIQQISLLFTQFWALFQEEIISFSRGQTSRHKLFSRGRMSTIDTGCSHTAPFQDRPQFVSNDRSAIDHLARDLLLLLSPSSLFLCFLSSFFYRLSDEEKKKLGRKNKMFDCR